MSEEPKDGPDKEDQDTSSKSGTSNGDGTGISLGGGKPEAAADDKGGAGDDNPFASLSDENQALAKEKGWASFDDAFKAYRGAQDLISRGEHKKAGSEGEGDGGEGGSTPSFKETDYVFNTPTDAQEIGYNEDFAKVFRGWSHAAGVDPKIAASYHDNFVEWSRGQLAGQAEASVEARQTSAREAEVVLTQEWGKPGTENFNRNLEFSRRAVRELGIDTNAIGVTFDQDGAPIITNAKFMAAMAKVGGTMFKEDTLFGDPTNGGADNPFDPNSSAHNVTAQGNITKNNPELAIQLIQALPEETRKRFANTLAGAQRRLAEMRK